MVPKREYTRFKNDCEVLEYHNNNHCTNIWLGLIFVVLLLQAIVVVGAGVTTALIYTNNQEKVDAWINLPWTDMAKTVGTTYDGLKVAPIHETITNAHVSSMKLRHMVDDLDKTTLSKVRVIADELMKNKDAISHISNITQATLPALKQINLLLQDQPVQDLTGVIHKTNKFMGYLDNNPEETKKNYARGTGIIDNVNHLISPGNVQRTINSIEKISKVMDSTLTPDNVDKTLHTISDFDSSLHKAESRMERIGQIFAKT